MADPQHPPAAPTFTGRPVVRAAPVPPPAATRGGTVATRSAAGATPPHAAVFAPWTDLLKQAEARYKTEVAAALADLDKASREAGQLLDTTAANAAESAAHLESLAWAAWSRYMAMADATRNSILDRARTSYEQALTYAHDQYDKAMGSAERTYRSIAQDAKRAQSDTAAIAS